MMQFLKWSIFNYYVCALRMYVYFPLYFLQLKLLMFIVQSYKIDYSLFEMHLNFVTNEVDLI